MKQSWRNAIYIKPHILLIDMVSIDNGSFSFPPSSFLSWCCSFWSDLLNFVTDLYSIIHIDYRLFHKIYTIGICMIKAWPYSPVKQLFNKTKWLLNTNILFFCGLVEVLAKLFGPQHFLKEEKLTWVFILCEKETWLTKFRFMIDGGLTMDG